MLANPYFVPDRGILRALQRAAARGVDVRLLVPLESDSRRARSGGAGGVRAVAGGGRAHLAAAARSSTRRLLVIDDAFVSIGSYNFDHRSLAYNLEMVVNVLDAPATKETIAMLEARHRRQRQS